MTERLKGVLPLAATIAVLAFIYVEFTANFTFHWVTNGDLGNGLDLPSNFHLVIPAGFVSWGFYFAAGGGMDGLRKVTIASIFGAVAGFLTMALTVAIGGLPDFWPISLSVLVFAFILVMLIAVGEWYFVPATFGAFASVVFWWIATGLDGWAEDGGGVGNSIEALGDPATAGAGAFGGVLSTPYPMVFVNVLVTLLIGCVFGYLSTLISDAITPNGEDETVHEEASVRETDDVT